MFRLLNFRAWPGLACPWATRPMQTSKAHIIDSKQFIIFAVCLLIQHNDVGEELTRLILAGVRLKVSVIKPHMCYSHAVLCQRAGLVRADCRR